MNLKSLGFKQFKEYESFQKTYIETHFFSKKNLVFESLNSVKHYSLFRPPILKTQLIAFTLIYLSAE